MSCGKAFPDFTLGTPSSGCSLSQILPCGSPKWSPHETIIFKFGKINQPWLTGRINPKSFCLCSLCDILLSFHLCSPLRQKEAVLPTACSELYVGSSRGGEGSGWRFAVEIVIMAPMSKLWGGCTAHLSRSLLISVVLAVSSALT